MKKVLSFALVLVLALSVVAYAATAEVANKTGIGAVISVEKCKDAVAEANGTAQVDTTMAAVTVDAAGKIVSVSIDVAQTKVGVTAAGAVLKDEVKLLTKKELGDDYGMKKSSAIGKEWYEQIAALEAWMVGKTIEEIKAIPFTVRDEAHQFVPNTPDLVASVTISIGDYIAAVEEAIANAK